MLVRFSPAGRAGITIPSPRWGEGWGEGDSVFIAAMSFGYCTLGKTAKVDLPVELA